MAKIPIPARDASSLAVSTKVEFGSLEAKARAMRQAPVFLCNSRFE
jgi:hypothetical protein